MEEFNKSIREAQIGMANEFATQLVKVERWRSQTNPSVPRMIMESEEKRLLTLNRGTTNIPEEILNQALGAARRKDARANSLFGMFRDAIRDELQWQTYSKNPDAAPLDSDEFNVSFRRFLATLPPDKISSAMTYLEHMFSKMVVELDHIDDEF